MLLMYYQLFMQRSRRSSQQPSHEHLRWLAVVAIRDVMDITSYIVSSKIEIGSNLYSGCSDALQGAMIAVTVVATIASIVATTLAVSIAPLVPPPYKAEPVIVLSFCKQDNWRTWKRTSTKLGRHGHGVNDPLELSNFRWWSGSACGFRVTFSLYFASGMRNLLRSIGNFRTFC